MRAQIGSMPIQREGGSLPIHPYVRGVTGCIIRDESSQFFHDDLVAHIEGVGDHCVERNDGHVVAPDDPEIVKSGFRVDGMKLGQKSAAEDDGFFVALIYRIDMYDAHDAELRIERGFQPVDDLVGFHE